MQNITPLFTADDYAAAPGLRERFKQVAVERRQRLVNQRIHLSSTEEPNITQRRERYKHTIANLQSNIARQEELLERKRAELTRYKSLLSNIPTPEEAIAALEQKIADHDEIVSAEFGDIQLQATLICDALTG